MPLPALQMTWRALRAQPLRSLEAAAGLIIAVAAAVAGASLAAGAERVRSDTPARGLGVLVLAAGPESVGLARASLKAASFASSDVDALQREVAGIERLAPATSQVAIVAAGNVARRTLVLGTTPDYFLLTEQPLAQGRWMSAEELLFGAPVCLLGAALAASLLGDVAPLNASVRIGTLTCSVIGVLAAGSNSDPDASDLLAMPLVTLQRGVLGTPTIESIYMRARGDHTPVVVAHQVDALMRERRRVDATAAADFSLRAARALDPSPASAAAEDAAAVLKGAALVSFLLGGLGLFASVRTSTAERRRQLASSSAPSSSRRALVVHLTLEAALLALLGGLLGSALGLVAARVWAHLGGYPVSVPIRALWLAPVAATLVAAAFGALGATSATRRSAPELPGRD
jgi:putative ABC transport system permease protein